MHEMAGRLLLGSGHTSFSSEPQFGQSVAARGTLIVKKRGVRATPTCEAALAGSVAAVRQV